MAWVFREDGHVVIDVFTGQIAGRKKKILNGISYFIVGIVSAVLIYYGFYATFDHFKRGVFNPTVIETPIALIIVVIPIGSIPLFPCSIGTEEYYGYQIISKHRFYVFHYSVNHFISCTNFRALEALPLLQEHFHLPIVTSNQAVIEKIKRSVSI